MPSIVIAIDSILKNYFDNFRNLRQLPPLIEGKVNGKLPKNIPKTLYYNDVENSIEICGKPDEYLELVTGEIVPFDHKTKSKPPENIHNAYQLQMDVYSFLLKENNYKTINLAYLAYYCPEKSMVHNGISIVAYIFEVKTDFNRVKLLIQQARKILDLEEPPTSSEKCSFCRWVKINYDKFYLTQTNSISGYKEKIYNYIKQN